MSKLIKFGEDVKGYDVPVLNEREIRAAAGIMFLAIIISLMLILVRQDFLLIKYVVTVFLADFFIRVFINPKFAPTLIIGRWIVSSQTPEYVGAAQKKFAWIIGVVLSAIMFVFLVLVNATSPITGLGCLFCLIFLFFEMAFGICLGCKVYSMLYKDKAHYCPGETCDKRSRQEIQKISQSQVLIVFGLILLVILVAVLFNDYYRINPHDLFGNRRSSHL